MKHLTPAECDTIYLERLIHEDHAVAAVDRARAVLVARFGKLVYVGVGRVVGAVRVHPDADFPSSPVATLGDVRPLTSGDVVASAAAGHPAAVKLFFELGQLSRSESWLDEATTAVRECQAEYDTRPWSRFYLVTSSSGHIHSSVRCSTCNKGRSHTQFALVPSLSGQDEAAAVADLGPALCSICYPSAPVEDREQASIPARLAILLREQGEPAFRGALAESRAKSAGRCPGTGQRGDSLTGGRVGCPVCGRSAKSATGLVRAHQPLVFFAVQEVGFSDKYWSGSVWGPSTKALPFASREAAAAVPGVEKIVKK